MYICGTYLLPVPVLMTGLGPLVVGPYTMPGEALLTLVLTPLGLASLGGFEEPGRSDLLVFVACEFGIRTVARTGPVRKHAS